jgi:hypothetical protein
MGSRASAPVALAVPFSRVGQADRGEEAVVFPVDPGGEPGLRLAVAPEALRWRLGLVLRGLEALPVTLREWA